MTAATSPESSRHQRRLKRTFEIWSPIVISLVALVVSVITLLLYQKQVNVERQRDVEEQRRIAIQSTPSVSVEQDIDTDDPFVGIKIQNDSQVIARLKKITYYVDRKPFDDASDVIEYGKLVDVGYTDFDDNSTLAAGASEWLIKKDTQAKGKQLDQFNDFIDNHVAVEVEVCSDITGKCQTQCSADGWCK